MIGRGRPATRALVGHADLVRVAAALIAEGRDVIAGLAEIAGELGFERLPPEPAESGGSGAATFERALDSAVAPASAQGAPEDVPLWQPITFAWHGDEQVRSLKARKRADAEAAADAQERRDMAQRPPPPTPPLSPRSRLAPMLHRALTTDIAGRNLDVPALVRGWSRGEQFRRLPRLRRRGWPALVLLLDRGFHLVPFWRDQLELRAHLHGLVGGAGLVVRFFDDRGPGGPAFDEDGRSTDLQDGTLAGLPVLALTDLGWYGGSRSRRAWLRLGRQLRRGGERIHALVPVPPSRWTPELTRAWAPMPWERPVACEPQAMAEREARASRVLDLAAHARRIEPGLLRALRLLLPRTEADVGTEADAWRHEDIAGMCADATVLRPDRTQVRRERFVDEARALRERAARVIHAWHWHRDRRPELWHTEALLLAVSGHEFVGEAAFARAQAFMAGIGQRAEKMVQGTAPTAEVQALRRWLDHTREQVPVLFDRTTVAGWGLQQAWGVTHPPDDPPPDADPRLLEQMGDEPPGAPRMYALRQVGCALEVWSQAAIEPMRVPPGGLVAPLWAAAPAVYPVGSEVAPPRVSLVEPVPIEVAPATALELRTDCATLGLRALHKPEWATALGRDHHGLWADVDVRGISFRLRWIPPGRFMMSSPETEQGRDDDEGPQREVVISHGLWLGETPVTQAVWRAVMDANPSRFKDDARPVEQVSFEDVERFIQAMNELVNKGGDEQYRLPTEAEWEYACRAGTTTATYGGELEIKGAINGPVLDEIAWYGGNSGVDYDLDEYHDSSDWPAKQHPHTRAGTRRVKQKQPNQWGLYDMLGNVWEWCMDDCGDCSPADSALVGPAVAGSEGVRRVYRGGGWLSSAGLVRAAFRDLVLPGLRDDDLGFRLARGQSPEGQAPGEPAKTATDPSTWDVFISYAHADFAWVKTFAEDLHALGLRVLLDEWSIAPEVDIIHQLEMAIHDSRNGILVVPSATTSRWWMMEVCTALMTHAAAKDFRLIPVLYADTEIPPMIATHAWLDLRGSTGDEYLEVVHRLARFLKDEASDPPPGRGPLRAL